MEVSMNCQAFQKNYLQNEGKIMTPELQDHLNQCKECQSYVKIVKAIMPAEPPKISAELDAKVLQGYRLITKNRNRRKRYSWILALASCLLLVFCVFALNHDKTEEKSQSITANKMPLHNVAASTEILASTAVSDSMNPIMEENLNKTETELENLELELDFLISSL